MRQKKTHNKYWRLPRIEIHMTKMKVNRHLLKNKMLIVVVFTDGYSVTVKIIG